MTVLDLSKANDFPSRIALLQTATQRIATHEARASGPCSRPNPPCGPKDCCPDPVEVTPTRVARNVCICEQSDSPCASRSSGSSAGKVRSVQREFCAACRIGQVRQASASRQAQWCGCDEFCVGFPLKETPKQMGQGEPKREASAKPDDRHGGQARLARARGFPSPSGELLWNESGRRFRHVVRKERKGNFDRLRFSAAENTFSNMRVRIKAVTVGCMVDSEDMADETRLLLRGQGPLGAVQRYSIAPHSPGSIRHLADFSSEYPAVSSLLY